MRCQNCKHWSFDRNRGHLYSRPATKGVCEKADRWGNDLCEPDFVPYEQDSLELLTDPAFGCIQFEGQNMSPDLTGHDIGHVAILRTACEGCLPVPPESFAEAIRWLAAMLPEDVLRELKRQALNDKTN